MAAKDIRNAYRLRSWRNNIDRLIAASECSLEDICEYTGMAWNGKETSFYIKLPKKRRTYIGIGMALKQPAEVINDWLTRYAGKRRLYIKDISEDLVWMYLINANLREDSPETNYFLRYEEFQSVAYAVFCEKWDEILMGYVDTAEVEVSLAQADYSEEYDGIKEFVAEHMDAFKTAYVRPREYLDMYVTHIIDTCRRNPANKTVRSLNSMRGYLDESMINFLSGNSETINVIDRNTGRRTINIKHVPRSRKKYICLCLALGMTTDDINCYLDMMGYAPLDSMDSDEAALMSLLSEWERSHPLQRAYKKRYFECEDSANLTEQEEFRAVESMLQLRADLTERCKAEGKEFPYA